MKLYPHTIDRNDQRTYEEKHYRAHWQPLWAIIGLVLCVLLMITGGWNAIYDLYAQTKGVTKEDSVVDLATAYLGVSYASPTKNNGMVKLTLCKPIMFFGIYLGYKLIYKTSLRPYSSFEDKWYPDSASINEQDCSLIQPLKRPKRPRSKVRAILDFLSWLR